MWLGDIPVATVRGSSIFYVHTDHLNAPKKVTRPSDNGVRWSWDRDPFGTTTVNENPAGLGTFSYNLRLPGQFYDSETGLNYNYFRDYDPAIGRYIQSDPAGLRDGVNTYAYAGSNPSSFIDVLGLSKHDPSSQYCQDLRKKIENVRKDLEKRYDELRSNLQELPQRIGPGEKLADTVRGHRTLINIHTQNLRRLEDKYDAECDDACTYCSAVATGAKVVGTVGAGYIAYRCIRMLPSLAPPLWWTIPANVVAP